MEKIRIIMILEILGKPAEHVKQTLSTIVESLGKEKDVKIIYKKIAEPKPLKDDERIFTSFAEIELETTLQQLLFLVTVYMPSHIEITEPEDLKLKNADLNLFFNELVRKLHQYDEVAKAMLIEREIIAKQIQEGKIKVENIEPGSLVNEKPKRIKKISKKKKVKKKGKK